MLQRRIGGGATYTQYADDPVRFGREILGEHYTDEVRDLMYSVRDNMVTVARSANATGKTHAAARVATWWYKCFPGSQVYTAAAPPEKNLVNLLWGEINGLVERSPLLFEGDKVSHLSIKSTAQNFLIGVTIPTSGTKDQREAKFSGKHAPNLLFIIDEGDAVPDEVYKGIESCMSGGNARLLVMFNPRSQMGEVYRMERDGEANVVHLTAFKHPNVISGQDVIPGAVTRNTTVRRIRTWCRPLIEGEQKGTDCFELPGFLENVVGLDRNNNPLPALDPGWYRVMNPAFSYMVLGEYPSMGEKQLISADWIARARTRWDQWVAQYGEVPPAHTSGVMGLDVADMGEDSNCACFRYGGYVERLVLWGGVDAYVAAERGSNEFLERSQIEAAKIDRTGVGAGVAPRMQRNGCPAVGVHMGSAPTYDTELGKFLQIKDQLLWSVREWLRTDDTAMLPPDELLIEELRCFTYNTDNHRGYIQIMSRSDVKERIGRSPDRATALGLTFAPKSFFDDCVID